MRLVPILLILSLAAVTLAAPTASATGCIVGNDDAKCVVSVRVIYCFTDPCDGIIVCLDHGLVCSNRL